MCRGRFFCLVFVYMVLCGGDCVAFCENNMEWGCCGEACLLKLCRRMPVSGWHELCFLIRLCFNGTLTTYAGFECGNMVRKSIPVTKWCRHEGTAQDTFCGPQNIHVTGAAALLPGVTERIEAEVRAMRPFGYVVYTVVTKYRSLPEMKHLLMMAKQPFISLRTGICVTRAADPRLDAWRGAQSWASETVKQHGSMHSVAVSRQEYEEKGPEYLKEHSWANVYVATP